MGVLGYSPRWGWGQIKDGMTAFAWGQRTTGEDGDRTS